MNLRYINQEDSSDPNLNSYFCWFGRYRVCQISYITMKLSKIKLRSFQKNYEDFQQEKHYEE